MFYNYITKKRKDSQDLKDKMESAVEELLNRPTDLDHPGMLLGLIQSGKTRAFIGIIARGFDLKYSVCIVITKSSTALVQQTVKRIRSEFKDPVDSGNLNVYDVMKMPPLTKYIRDQKLIIVAKKEDDNLRKLHQLFFETYVDLGNKNVLIVDDEADFASVTYHSDKTQPDGVKFGVLANQISEFRASLNDNSDFLQVTATPYSLYLQPNKIVVNSKGYEPLRPSFTIVLPTHPMYVGGKVYFEDSQDLKSYASHIYFAVKADEFEKLKVLKSSRKPDSRLLNNILSTSKLTGFRDAFINYIVAGSIRSLQEELNQQSNNEIWKERYKSAFLVHVHTGQKSHQWQYELINKLIDKLNLLKKKEYKSFSSLIELSYRQFQESIEKSKLICPNFDKVLKRVCIAFENGEISVKQVNSENSVLDLLDDDGQLRLDNPFNIFIGGQVLDRGITIDHLIAFYYGRNPDSFQMDTVLQHSRMYGARSLSDMSVTRLYTSVRIYNAMKEMHFFDDALRSCALRGERVKFVQRSKDGRIKPCGPNKVAISSLLTIKPNKRFLPYGFQTISKSKLLIETIKIDKWIKKSGGKDAEKGWLCDIDDVELIIRKIRSTYVYSPLYENEDLNWDITSYLDTIKYSSQGKKQIYVMTRTDRNLSRKKNFNTAWADAPDDGRKDLIPAKKLALNHPVLLLIRQNGKKSQGWQDSPFYWPVFITQSNLQTSIYSED